jgi:hypothetical protein
MGRKTMTTIDDVYVCARESCPTWAVAVCNLRSEGAVHTTTLKHTHRFSQPELRTQVDVGLISFRAGSHVTLSPQGSTSKQTLN